VFNNVKTGIGDESGRLERDSSREWKLPKSDGEKVIKQEKRFLGWGFWCGQSPSKISGAEAKEREETREQAEILSRIAKEKSALKTRGESRKVEVSLGGHSYTIKMTLRWRWLCFRRVDMEILPMKGDAGSFDGDGPDFTPMVDREVTAIPQPIVFCSNAKKLCEKIKVAAFFSEEFEKKLASLEQSTRESFPGDRSVWIDERTDLLRNMRKFCKGKLLSHVQLERLSAITMNLLFEVLKKKTAQLVDHEVSLSREKWKQQKKKIIGASLAFGKEAINVHGTCLSHLNDNCDYENRGIRHKYANLSRDSQADALEHDYVDAPLAALLSAYANARKKDLFDAKPLFKEDMARVKERANGLKKQFLEFINVCRACSTAAFELGTYGRELPERFN
jgi:hypothetical protein